MKQSLYNIIEEQKYTLQEVELMEGELTPELEEQLVINATQLESKSIAYLEVIKTKDAYNVMIKEEIKRLQAMVKRNDTLVTRLKDNLLIAVKTFGDFESGFTKFGTRKSSTVEVEDVNQLPNEYKTIKVTEAADKKAIKEALQSGNEIIGCSIVDHQNLKIN
tara:strand:+ start:5261 stop:5749 length:489 start_codon:yes stop_codon:yes gene_type:complete